MNSKLSLNSTFVKRLNLIMTDFGLPSEIQARAMVLSNLCKVSPQASRKWLKGTSLPYYDKMLNIANHFSVTVSYLLGEVPLKSHIELSKSTKIISEDTSSAISIKIIDGDYGDVMLEGDTAICYPCSKVTINDAIYVLQVGSGRHFRKLSINEQGYLVSRSLSDKESDLEVVKVPFLIDVYLECLLGRVEAIIREL